MKDQFGRAQRTSLSRGAIWLALVAGIVIATGAIALWYVIDHRAHEHIDVSTHQVATVARVLIRLDVDHRFMALDRLAQRWTETGGRTRTAWEADAARYVADMPGFESIERMNSTLRDRWSVWRDTPEDPRSRDIARFEPVRLAIVAARESGEMISTAPFSVDDSALCIAVIRPVLRDGVYDGVIVGVLRLDTWIQSVIGKVQTADHHVRMLLQGTEVYRYDADDDSLDAAETERSTFQTSGLEWTTEITPASNFLSAGHADTSSLVLVAGLLLSALVSTVIYLGLMARARSRQFRETAIRFETLVQNLPGMAYRRTNAPGKNLAFVSEGCRALTGYQRRELNEARPSWDELIDVSDRERVTTEIDQAIERAGPFELEYRIIDRDGNQKWVWERGRLIDSEFDDVPHMEGIVSDITDRKRAEDEARQYREHLAHVDRLNMLGEMATGIAHEINQPLTAISLFAQAGTRLMESEDRKRLPEIFEKLIQHAHRASAVIERIQSMTRQHESVRSIIDCESLVLEVAKLAEAEARIRDMTIQVHTDHGLSNVEVDAVQIQQVALNLLKNGMESMKSIDCLHGNSIRLEVKLDDNDYIEISVVDRGTGVSDEIAKVLFAPFSTTKKSGMGMGLSISRAIVLAHGGRLDYRNNEFGGATFFFTLPPANHGEQDD